MALERENGAGETIPAENEEETEEKGTCGRGGVLRCSRTRLRRRWGSEARKFGGESVRLRASSRESRRGSVQGFIGWLEAVEVGPGPGVKARLQCVA